MYREHDTRHTTANLIGSAENVMKTFAHSDMKTSMIYLGQKHDLLTRSESIKKIGQRVDKIMDKNKNSKITITKNGRILGRGERI